MKSFLLLFLAIIINSCASLSKEECAQMNWHEKGKKDGSFGVGVNSISRYQTQCQEHGQGVDEKSYIQVHAEGLILFCSSERGENDGIAGHDMNTSCHTFENYARAHSLGLASFCSYKNGLDQGMRGEDLNRKCSNFMAYVRGHEQGYKNFVIEEKKKKERQRVLSRLEMMYSGKKCKSKKDCQIGRASCENNRCQDTGLSCVTSVDCPQYSQCLVVSDWTSSGEKVSTKLCNDR